MIKASCLRSVYKATMDTIFAPEYKKKGNYTTMAIEDV